MAARGIAKRYAQAAFEIAKANGTEQQWIGDLTTLANAASDPSVGGYFSSPNAPVSDKLSALESILPNDGQQLVRNLGSMLLQRHRFHILPDVLEVFRVLWLDEQGIAVAEVTTAVELTDAERADVQQRLQSVAGREIEMRTKVDPSMVGGLVARIGDWLIDGSVETQLRNLRATLTR